MESQYPSGVVEMSVDEFMDSQRLQKMKTDRIAELWLQNQKLERENESLRLQLPHLRKVIEAWKARAKTA